MRNFAGNDVYHPKVFLAHDASGSPERFLVGSANLSRVAFSASVEAGVIGADATGLRTLHKWFDDLFDTRSTAFTPERLQRMEEAWRLAAAARARVRLRLRRETPAPPRGTLAVEAEDLDAIEDILATIRLPIRLLNMDHAGNTIRNIDRVRTLLADWNDVRRSPAEAADKQRNELKNLGFADGMSLTPLGRAAAEARSDAEVAGLWCEWLKRTPDVALRPRLVDAKRVLAQFWRLQPDVRDYFLANAQRPSNRRLLQTIELLCNASGVVEDLSLDDIRTLVPLLDQPHQLPPHLRVAIADYFENKGERTWNFPDRRTVPNAWSAAAERVERAR